MKIYFLSVFVILATWVLAENENCDPETIDNDALRLGVAFEQADIVNEILPEAPSTILKISFETAEVVLGNCIYTVRTVVPPKVKYEGDPQCNYTLAFWNLDVPSRVAPVLSSYLMYLAVNINGTSIDMDSGDEIASWINASPTVGSGKHRCLAVVHPQPGYINPMNRTLIDLAVFRLNLNQPELATNFSLGAPVAGNFWQATIFTEEDKYWKLDQTGYCNLDHSEYCQSDHTRCCQSDHPECSELDHTESCASPCSMEDCK
ncbi:protein D1-like [Bicyclus anynana]|uniref:Protein D1-like n=1 Tax=Bicyclus anynana TaxID=110368 RepID=A0A6J1NR61_BICAN|nr:protein D1-like [Bicyclus anynana]